MNKKNTVKIHDAKVDNHTPVVALGDDNNLAVEHYGCFGTGPYIRCDELIAALKAHEPRTDVDRVKFISQGRYDIDFYRSGTCTIYDNENKDSILGDFDSWTEAVDALMDMEEIHG